MKPNMTRQFRLKQYRVKFYGAIPISLEGAAAAAFRWVMECPMERILEGHRIEFAAVERLT